MKRQLPKFIGKRARLLGLVGALLAGSVTHLFAQAYVQTTCTFYFSGSVETWVVPAHVTQVTIVARGGQGGDKGSGQTGGNGAIMQGDFTVTPGSTLNMLVGQKGGFNGSSSGPTGNQSGAGGGGGTFVWTGDFPTTNLMIAAGGGGGAAKLSDNIAEHAVTSTSGNTGWLGAAGGTGGNGGLRGWPFGADAAAAGGGAGWLTDGDGSVSGGKSPANGAAGGLPVKSTAGQGGYGGGGGGGFGGGGGGGYSGGGGGGWSNPGHHGGGGGSFNAGTNQVNSVGHTEDGMITITYLGLDADEDGYATVDDCGNDCDDSDPTVYYDAPELCDGKDNDCDGDTDEDITFYYYEDNDGDGFGNPATEIYTCDPPPDYVQNGTDCDDTEANINPGIPENLSNGIDDNCDGLVDVEPVVLYGTTSDGGDQEAGFIFKFVPATGDITLLHEFTWDDGAYPKGDLLFLNGKLYGLTSDGGDNGAGVLFEYEVTSGDYTVLHHFDYDAGGYPEGSLTELGGKLYGMAQSGGIYESGVLFEYDPALEVYSVLHDFDYDNDGGYPYEDLLVADGKLYGMTSEGGPNYSGVVFEYDPAMDVYTVVHEFNYSSGGYPYGGLLKVGDDFYGMTNSGGDEEYGVIFQFTPTTGDYTVLHNFDYNDGGDPNGSLIEYNGKLYGMTRDGGAEEVGVLFEYDPATNDYTNLVDFDFENGRQPYGDLLENGGKFYGMTRRGGEEGDGVIFEYDVATDVFAVKYNFDYDHGSFPYGSLITIPVTCTPVPWYADGDEDGYGDPDISVVDCAAPDGYVANNTDCDDGNDLLNPGMAEVCDGIDNDCDGLIDMLDPNFVDNTPPTITCPSGSPFTRNTDAMECNFTVQGTEFDPTAFGDNCSGATISNSFNNMASLANADLPHGQTTITWTVTDGANLSTTCAIVVTVQDNTKPTLADCPSNILLKTNDDDGADCAVQVTYTPPTFADNCDGTGAATYVSGPMSGASLTVGGSPYTVVYTYSDLAGNAVLTDCSFTVMVQDNTLPMLTCPSSNTLTPPSGSCSYTISGTTYDPTGVDDNCGVAGVGNDFNNMATLNGAILPTGANLVEWTVTDVNGLMQTCQFTLTVSACVEITGTIFWKGDGVAGVSNANVALTGEATNSDMSDINGEYNMVTNTGDDFVITPTKNTGGMLNGVTAADATVIQRHLTGNELITNFYRLIAADCNRSNNISSVDAALIRQALLGNPSSLNILNAAGHWRFVRTDYVPVLAGPYTLDHFALYNKRVLSGVSGMQPAQDFYGVKAGDVFEESNPGVDVADPTLKPDPDAKPLVWRVRDRLLKTGQTIELDFSVANFTDIAAYQYGMRFDPAVLQYQQATGTNTDVALDEAGHFGTYQIVKGELRTLWSVDEGKTLPGVQPMYRLRFKVLQGGKKLSEVLGLDPAILAALAYTSQLAQREVQLVFTDYVQPGQNLPDVLAGDYFDLLQNRPNPFSERTTIGFILPMACDAQLRVFDISGRELWRMDKTYPAGYNEETVRLEEIGSTGMLFYELTTPQGKQTRKMLAVRL